MATEFVNFILPNYIPDWDVLAKLDKISGRFNRPPGLPDAGVTAILAAIGTTGSPAVPKTSANKSVLCLPPSSFRPRKLKFSFASGGSMAIPFASRLSSKTVASSLKNILQTQLGTTVTCIELIGEEWIRMDEELRPTATIVAAGADIRPTTGTKNPIYTASFTYQTDASNSSVQSIRMNTNSTAIPAVPFSPYGAAIASAIGTPLPFSGGCGGGSSIVPRHYVAKIFTTNGANPIRQMAIPVASNISTNIKNVGVAIATVTQTLCLAYFGESDPRFSRLIP